ncbi:MAG: hypothetical protein V1781_09385 [Bacteroidota bacterium]
MSSTSETGHAINVSNFGIMISRVQGFGSRYNPTNATIKISNLQITFNNGSTSMVAVTNTKPPFTNSVNARHQLFNDMEKLSTRGINAYDATQGVTKAQVDSAKTYIRKIRGARKNKIVVAPPSPDAIIPATERQISVSQQSYDQQVEHFSKLIALFAFVPTYVPNETELQNAPLSSFLTQLKNINTAVINSTTPYLTAIQNRNNVLYTSDIGLVDLAQEVKKYVKSVKTITLAEFRQISGLKFTHPKKKK